MRPTAFLFYHTTQALFMFTPSWFTVSQTDDVSNWRAWNILKQSMERNHTFTSLGWVPNEKKSKKRFEPVLEEEQGNLVFLVVSWLSFFQAFLAGPGVKSEDRNKGDSYQDFRGWLQFWFEFSETAGGLRDEWCQPVFHLHDHKMLLEARSQKTELKGPKLTTAHLNQDDRLINNFVTLKQ